MKTRPRRKKAKAAAKKTAKKPAAKKAAAKKKPVGKAASKTHGAKSARRRKKGAAPGKVLKRSARRRLAGPGASGRRLKAIVRRGPARARVAARRRIAKPSAVAPRVPGVAIKAPLGPRYAEILTPAALRFLADLHREFEAARERILAARAEQQRDDADAPPALPAAARDIVVVDFGRTTAPTWTSSVEGQINIKDRWRRKRAVVDAARNRRALVGRPAVLIVRPRDWHLLEELLTVDGEPISASLFDFGLTVFHNAKAQIAAGSGPRFHLPKLEAPDEARLWGEVFAFALERLGLPADTIRATARIDELSADF
ncbi:MAG: malate synthase [Acidimicrobiaceae bacterium]